MIGQPVARVCILLSPSSAATFGSYVFPAFRYLVEVMNVDGLAIAWDSDPMVRERLRRESKLNLHPVSQKWCEATRVNCTTNACILKPCLKRLREHPEKKLPYLEPLQDQIAKLWEVVGHPVDDKQVYTGSVEIKRMLGLVKRRAGKRQVTKDRLIAKWLVLILKKC